MIIHIEGKEFKLEVLNGVIFITPMSEARQGWEKSIDDIIAAHGKEKLDTEWLDSELTSHIF